MVPASIASLSKASWHFLVPTHHAVQSPLPSGGLGLLPALTVGDTAVLSSWIKHLCGSRFRPSGHGPCGGMAWSPGNPTLALEGALNCLPGFAACQSWWLLPSQGAFPFAETDRTTLCCNY